MLPRGVHSRRKTTARWLPRSREDPNANPHAIDDRRSTVRLSAALILKILEVGLHGVHRISLREIYIYIRRRRTTQRPHHAHSTYHASDRGRPRSDPRWYPIPAAEREPRGRRPVPIPPARPYPHDHTVSAMPNPATVSGHRVLSGVDSSTARQRAQPCGFSSEDGRRGGWSRPTSSPTVGFPALDATSFDLGIYIYTVTLTPQFSTVRTDVRRVRHRDQTRRLSCRDSDLVPAQSAWQLSCICVLDGARARTGR